MTYCFFCYARVRKIGHSRFYLNLSPPSLYSCACCGVCVTHAAGTKTRRPLSFPLADLLLLNVLRLHPVGRMN